MSDECFPCVGTRITVRNYNTKLVMTGAPKTYLYKTPRSLLQRVGVFVGAFACRRSETLRKRTFWIKLDSETTSKPLGSRMLEKIKNSTRDHFEGENTRENLTQATSRTRQIRETLLQATSRSRRLEKTRENSNFRSRKLEKT